MPPLIVCTVAAGSPSTSIASMFEGERLCHDRADVRDELATFSGKEKADNPH
jgi:hypothetical protein